MIPVAGLLAERGRWAKALSLVAAGLALIGGLEMLMFQGAGARIQNDVPDAEGRRKVPLVEPLRDAVWPLWAGEPSPALKPFVQCFSRNLVRMAAPAWVKRLAPQWRFLQVLPLVVAQCLAIAVLVKTTKRRDPARSAITGELPSPIL
jgi:hypothetical protein